MDLSGKRIVITGAAGGLGRAVTAAVIAQGGTPLLVDLAFPADFAPGEEKFAFDLTDTAATAREVARMGHIDGLMNLAGGFHMGPSHDIGDDGWDAMFRINVQTLRSMVAAVVPKMLAQGRGTIVNVGALGAVQGQAQLGAYGASKSVVMRLTESLSAELRERGINVNAVLPSIIDTPANRKDMPDADPAKWVAPADLARVICFLASDAARAIHGALVPVRGLS
ncbi:MAG: SDR family NAD(P)-dependent oxidoreductase [Porticoccaceae bacterium]|jgi:NAD(P)-dependent dehydrogenase (short-subunit alcohol dehydrogenase family)|nr:SDR family NAD(P)-dependent oxidoreductase [Porticoccaceae bacterium]HLS98352.1 SDR family NAD(P)-dependent oxidoreductase [Porticoccaceae bacterium]